jgi:hypothetical protein
MGDDTSTEEHRRTQSMLVGILKWILNPYTLANASESSLVRLLYNFINLAVPDYLVREICYEYHVMHSHNIKKMPNHLLLNKYEVGNKGYRFENWNLRRAPGCPYFLRSTIRESRVRNPFRFNTP